jgi:hypothetical protein
VVLILNNMPAGVSWGSYLRFTAAALFTMFAGAQIVHVYYKPLGDLDKYVEKVEKQHEEYRKALEEQRKKKT